MIYYIGFYCGFQAMKFIMVVKSLRESKDGYKSNLCGWNNLTYHLDKNGVKKKTQRNTTSANKIRLQITHDRIRPSFYVFSWEEGFISEFKGYFLKRKWTMFDI